MLTRIRGTGVYDKEVLFMNSPVFQQHVRESKFTSDIKESIIIIAMELGANYTNVRKGKVTTAQGIKTQATTHTSSGGCNIC